MTYKNSFLEKKLFTKYTLSTHPVTHWEGIPTISINR